MTFTNTDLVKLCAQDSSNHASTQALGANTYAAVLASLRSWLLALFSERRGANIPIFARVTWRRVTAADSQQLLRPVFIPSDSYLRAHSLHATPAAPAAADLADLEPCEDFSAMRIAIKFSCSLNKDVVYSCTRHLLQQLGETCRSGRPVLLDLGVGVLSSRDRTLSFQFRPAYLAPWPSTGAATIASEPGDQPTSHQRQTLRQPPGETLTNEPSQRGAGTSRSRSVPRSACGASKAVPREQPRPAAKPGRPGGVQADGSVEESDAVGGGSRGVSSPGRTRGPVAAAQPAPLHSPGSGEASAAGDIPPGRATASAAAQPRPAWGVRVPPPSPRRGPPQSPRSKAGSGLTRWPRHSDEYAAGQGAVSPGRPLSPGCEGRRAHELWDDGDGHLREDAAVPVAMAGAMPVARTIQLATRTPRARPTSPSSHAAPQRVAADPAVARPRPSSAPRIRMPTADTDTTKARKADTTECPSLGDIRAAVGATGRRWPAGPLPGSPEAGTPYLLPVYTAVPDMLQADSQGRGPRGAMCTAARRQPPASPRGGLDQRPAWGAGKGAQLRLKAGAGVSSAAPRPASAPRLRPAAGPGEARPVASSTGAAEPQPAVVAAEAVAEEQSVWFRSAWMSRGSDVNQLWSPDSKPAPASRGSSRSAARQTGPTAGVSRAVGSASSGKELEPDRQQLQDQRPSRRQPYMQAAELPRKDPPGDLSDRSVETGFVAAPGGVAVQSGTSARKPLFLSPQKGSAAPINAGGRPQAGGIELAGGTGQAHASGWKPAGPAAGPAAAVVCTKRLEGAEDRDQVLRRRRDQQSKDTVGAAVALPGGTAQLLAPVRALGAGPRSPSFNLRYREDGGQEFSHQPPVRRVAEGGAAGAGSGYRQDAIARVAGEDSALVQLANHRDSQQTRDAGSHRPGPGMPRAGATGQPLSSDPPGGDFKPLVDGRSLTAASGRVGGARDGAAIPGKAAGVGRGSIIPFDGHMACSVGGVSGRSLGGTASVEFRSSSGGCVEEWSSWGGARSEPSSLHHGEGDGHGDDDADGYPLPLYCSSSSMESAIADRGLHFSHNSAVGLGASRLLTDGSAAGGGEEGGHDGGSAKPLSDTYADMDSARAIRREALPELDDDDLPGPAWPVRSAS